MKAHKIKKIAVALATVFFMAPFVSNIITLNNNVLPAANASARSYGHDDSKYQGPTLGKVYPQDEFAIAQIGGSNGGYLYDQWTYSSQVKTGIANGLRMHTYLWDQTGSSIAWTDQMLDYFLPRIQTPKGSIVALDYEAGASGDVEANTENILHGMCRIRDAGYTPMYYSYKPYTLAHVDWARINREFPNSGWIAAYPDYQVRTQPYWGVFPSMDGVSIYQFTSTYRAGGLDGNISLAPNGKDITWNGYKNGNSQKPKTNTPAVTTGKQLHRDSHNYTVMPGDSWWKIATEHHMNMYALAQLNGATIQTVIHPGQVLRVADSGQGSKVSNKVQQPIASPKQSSWRDSLGDTWHAEKGTFVANTWLHLRWGAKPSSSSIALIGPGSVIKYDAYSRHNGFVYVRQPRGNGQYGYVAVRNAYTNEPYGKFE